MLLVQRRDRNLPATWSHRQIRAGDRIEAIRRPGHTVTIGRSFRAPTPEPEVLPRLLEADDDLPPDERAAVLRRTN